MSKILLYGANGYTAGLIIEKMLLAGIRPTLAGRTEVKVSKIAKKFGLDHLIFDLKDPPMNQLSEFEIFFNAAGPYSKTIRPALNLCIERGMHYLDITGEIAVFEYVASQSDRLKEAGVIAVPGVGFDIVPTDVLAYYLNENLGNAEELSLAFVSNGALSRGTAKTMVENLGKGSAVRKNGRIETVGSLDYQKKITFGKKLANCFCIPWGDVSTAYYSTGIPNIVVYMPYNKLMYAGLKLMDLLAPLLARKNFINIAQKVVGMLIFGPSEEQRERGKIKVWGEVRDSKGKTLQAKLETPDGYEFTAISSVAGVQFFLESKNKKEGGFFTPSLLFGLDYLREKINLNPVLISSTEL